MRFKNGGAMSLLSRRAILRSFSLWKAGTRASASWIFLSNVTFIFTMIPDFGLGA